MLNQIPELSVYLAHAYNARTGSFLSQPVFNLTYDNGQSINWGSNTDMRAVPDQIVASAATFGREVQQTSLLETSADYDRLYSATVNIEFSGVEWSGSGSSSLLYHGNLFQSASKVYSLNYFLQQVLEFNRYTIKPSGLTSQFVQDLLALPATATSAANQASYVNFFNTYGTHYVTNGTMGGTIVMESAIDDSILNTTTTTDITAGMQAGFNGVIDSGSLSASAAYNSSDFLKQHANNVQVTLNVLGGLLDSSSTSTAAWHQSLYVSPTLMLTQYEAKAQPLSNLLCISNLVPILGGNPQIAENIVTMLSIYLQTGKAADGFITTPKKVTPNAVTRASVGDQIVFGFLQAGSQNKSTNTLTAMEDDNSSNPVTVRALASVDYSSSDDTHVSSAAFFMPVRYNSDFNVQVPASSTVSASLYGVGFGPADMGSLGAWTTIALNSTITAPSDGFVVATIDWNKDNGARGYVQGSQQVSNNGQTVKEVVAAASQHHYSNDGTYINNNSFCMPVSQGQAYSVAFEKTSKTPVATAFFIPLMPSGALAFSGPLQQRSEGTTYTADTDGFLMAYLSYGSSDGGRGHVNLYTFKNQGDTPTNDTDLMSLGLQASTSVHQYKKSDTYVPYNTVCIPVPKGNAYKAVLTKTSESPKVLVTWMPLVARS